MNGVLVSVTSVSVSPDLSIARAHISVFPSERGAEIVKNLTLCATSLFLDLGTDMFGNTTDILHHLNGIFEYEGVYLLNNILLFFIFTEIRNKKSLIDVSALDMLVSAILSFNIEKRADILKVGHY